jgi:DNA-binding SARP family transcriptional activator/tetratricopeptide (TPR) repeat protein
MGVMTVLPGPVRVCLVGELRVEIGEVVHRGAQLGSRKARTVLALLTVEPERSRSADEIARVLWPNGAPGSALATVASLVSRLRRTTTPDLITGGRDGYRIGPSPLVEVDLARADALISEAERRQNSQPGLAAAASGAALELLDGTPLADVVADDWGDLARERYRVAVRRARLLAGRSRVAVGDHAAAAAVCRAALIDDPVDEEAARTLMTALGASGEPAAALRVYEALRTRLADELGADPAPATARLHQQLLRHGVPAGNDAARIVTGPGPLVGRDHEFGVLRDAWAKATAGTGSLILVTGEAGAGKTRLTSELARLAEDTGGLVLQARCYEAERALFLQPLVEAITDGMHRLPPEEMRAAAAPHRDVLARFVPQLAGLVDVPHPDRSRADVERRRAADAVVGFLSGLAGDRTVLVVLDDLHNSGSSTTEVLHYLRTVLPTTRLMVAATVRTESGSEAIATLAEVADTVRVGPLPRTAVHQLAIAAGRGDRADEIARRTGGHALFVTEILRGDPNALPATLQSAVLARVAASGHAVDTLLRAAAVLGAAFEPRHAAALAGVPLAAALGDCERALRAGLLRTADRAYEFANDLLREVLYETTPAPTRAAYHAQSVDLLTDAPEQVATHAAAIEDWLRASRAWLVAGERALRDFAANDAAALAGRALSAAQQGGSVELAGRALVLRGRARDGLNDFTGAWADFVAAEDAARQAGDQRLEMAVLREQAGNVPVALGNPTTVNIEPLRRCLRLAESLGDRITEVDILDRLTVLCVSQLDFTEAFACAERALRTARSSGQEDALVLALDAAKSAHAYLGEVDQLAEVVAELEPMLRRSGDLYLLQWMLFESAFVPLAAGDYSAAHEMIEAAIDVNRRSGYAPFESYYIAYEAWAQRLAGDLDAAATTGAHAVASARTHGHAWWLSTAVGIHATTLMELGRREAAVDLLEGVRPRVQEPGANGYLARWLCPLAEASGSTGVITQADNVLRSIAAPAGTAWLAAADTYLAVGRAWLREGDVERAVTTVAPLVDAAGRVGWADLVRLGEQIG